MPSCGAVATARTALLALLALLATGCGVGAAEVADPEATAARVAGEAGAPAEGRGPQGAGTTSGTRRWMTPRRIFAIARVRAGRSVTLRAAPGGRPVKRLRSRTEFGSRRFLAVAARERGWLGVVSAERPNGRLGWVDGGSSALTPYRTDVSLHVDLSRRELVLREGTRIRRRVHVGIGRAGYPTPSGRFAVTDKLSGRAYGGTYGCCIVALSGHQTRLPPGWPGGDRLALHGTRDQGSIGNAASTGCLRASDDDLRALLRRVPLGAPVFIRR